MSQSNYGVSKTVSLFDAPSSKASDVPSGAEMYRELIGLKSDVNSMSASLNTMFAQSQELNAKVRQKGCFPRV
jgi:hypothetical protein